MNQKIFDHFLKVKSVTTDTRKLKEGDIFFCLRGDNFNGNQFAERAISEGASLVVADDKTLAQHEKIIFVENALQALQQTAKLYRDTFSIPVLGITGSNGKTTTKELLRDVLIKKFKVHATEGNLNNHIGVPLTILNMPDDTQFAIIEMGANHRGEIGSYCQYACPNYGLITNMGKAHLEGFGGVDGIRKGKRELYDYVQNHGGQIFVNTEFDNLREESEGMNRIAYGLTHLQLEVIDESPSLTYRCGDIEVATQMAGGYNIYNIASALVVGRHFGVSEQDIHDAISGYMPDSNRSQLKQTQNNMLIMDAYNANPSSMHHALISLARRKEKHKFFVIGDMRELGQDSLSEHRNILEQATELGLNGIVIGNYFKQLENEYSFPAFTDNREAKEYLEQLELEDYIILLKGSRSMKLEEVASAL